MVNGKGAGEATLIVWDGGSAPPVTTSVSPADNSDRSRIRAESCRQGLPEGVQMSGSGDTIVLTGTVKDAHRGEAPRGPGVGARQEGRQPAADAAGSPSRGRSCCRSSSPPSIGWRCRSSDSISSAATQRSWRHHHRSNSSHLASASYSLRTSHSRIPAVNFADLLNLFMLPSGSEYRRDHQGVEQRETCCRFWPSRTSSRWKERKQLPGRRLVPLPVLTSTSTGGATAPVVTVQFKPSACSSISRRRSPRPARSTEGGAGSEFARLSPTRSRSGLPDPGARAAAAETEVVLRDGESFAIAGLIDNRVMSDSQQDPGIGRYPDSRPAFQQPVDTEIDGRTAGGGHAALRQTAVAGGEG